MTEPTVLGKLEDELNDVMEAVNSVNESMREGKIGTALFLVDLIPSSYRKDGLYAGIALHISGHKTEGMPPEGAALVDSLLAYCTSHSKYLKH